MKLIQLIQEIGDASNPVPYTKTSEEKGKYQTTISYQFKIGEDTYIVTTWVSQYDSYNIKPNFKNKKNSTTMEVMFGAWSDHEDLQTVGSTASTNKGVQYKVMATVTKILKDYVDKHPELVEIAYEPVKRTKTDLARKRLYRAYIEKNLPDWEYTEDSYGWIYLNKSGIEPTGFWQKMNNKLKK